MHVVPSHKNLFEKCQLLRKRKRRRKRYDVRGDVSGRDAIDAVAYPFKPSEIISLMSHLTLRPLLQSQVLPYYHEDFLFSSIFEKMWHSKPTVERMWDADRM
jgi:hypothetical protein